MTAKTEKPSVTSRVEAKVAKTSVNSLTRAAGYVGELWGGSENAFDGGSDRGFVKTVLYNEQQRDEVCKSAGITAARFAEILATRS